MAEPGRAFSAPTLQAGTGHIICGVQGKVELQSPLFNTKNSNMAATEPQTKYRALFARVGSYSLHRLCAQETGLASDIMGWVILCCGDCLVHCRILNCVPGLYPLQASSTHNGDGLKFLVWKIGAFREGPWVT